MSLFHGPFAMFEHSRRRHARLHEPISPRLPNLIKRHPSAFGVVLVASGVAGVWYVSTRLPNWPEWTLFPSLIISVLALVGLIVGLGILVVSGLEPLLERMDWEWHGEPLAALGLPLALSRKVESIGYWTAEDVAKAVNSNSFPWTRLDYDERLQVERAAQRWTASAAAQEQHGAAAERVSGRPRRRGLSPRDARRSDR